MGGASLGSHGPGDPRAVKVVYVIDSLALGGAERSLVEMVPHLVHGGVDITVAVLHDRAGLTGSARSAGADVVTLAGDGHVARARSLRALLGHVRPDVVHTTLFDADIVGRIAGRTARVAVTGSLVHNYGAEHRQPAVAGWKHRLAAVAEATTARACPRLHAVSPSVAASASRALRYPRERITVVPRGRDPLAMGERTPERRRAARLGLGIGDDAVLALLVGRQEHQKGFEAFLRSIPDLRRAFPRFEVRLAGPRGSATGAIRRAAVDVGLDPEAVLLGERSDVAELLCAADVFVLASISEGMPGALLEAMALEVPIVARDISAVRDVLEDGRHLVRGDTAWPSAVASSMGDGETISGRRRRFDAHFTVESSASRMIQFWADLSDLPR